MDSQAEEDEEKEGLYYDDLLLTNVAEVEIHESKEEVKIESSVEGSWDCPSSSYLSSSQPQIVIKSESDFGYNLDTTKFSPGSEIKTELPPKVEGSDEIPARPIVLRVEEPELRRLSVYEGSFFKCLLCAYRTSKKDRIRRHVLGKHSDLKPHSCPHCGYAAVEAGTVQRHMRTVHAKEKRYACPFCDHKCAEAGNLRHHVKAIHEKDKQFKCDQCDYRAVQERWLKHHKRIKHSGERLFPCPFCDHSAAQLAHLKTHMAAKHTGEKPNTCPYCPYRSVQASVMKRHIRNKHSADTPS